MSLACYLLFKRFIVALDLGNCHLPRERSREYCIYICAWGVICVWGISDFSLEIALLSDSNDSLINILRYFLETTFVCKAMSTAKKKKSMAIYLIALVKR